MMTIVVIIHVDEKSLENRLIAYTIWIQKVLKVEHWFGKTTKGQIKRFLTEKHTISK